MPAELKDKPAEEVAKYYSDKYKDFDKYKTDAEEWGKLGKRDEVASSRDSYSKIQQALASGKVIITRPDGQIYAVDPSTLTPAERREANQNPVNQPQQPVNPDDIDDDAWDELPPRKQRALMKAWTKHELDSTVAAKEKQWGETISNAAGISTRQIDTVLQIQAALQDNPEIKLKDMLTRMATLAAQGAANPMQAALDEIRMPAAIEKRAEARAAEIIAERQLKADKDKAEKVLATGSPLARVMRGGKQPSGKVTNEQIIAGLRDKGMLN